MNYKTFINQEAFTQASADYIKSVLKTEAETVFIALSGGKTPLPVYQELNPEDVERAEFFLVDERMVPQEDADSNYGAIREALPEDALLQPIDTLLSPRQAALRYQAALESIPGGKLDLAVLGLGRDGHTASLFPNDKEAHESTQTVIPTINPTAPNPPIRERITLTFNFLRRAKKILLLVSGSDKQAAVEELLHGSKTPLEFPAKNLLEHPELTIVIKTLKHKNIKTSGEG